MNYSARIPPFPVNGSNLHSSHNSFSHNSFNETFKQFAKDAKSYWKELSTIKKAAWIASAIFSFGLSGFAFRKAVDNFIQAQTQRKTEVKNNKIISVKNETKSSKSSSSQKSQYHSCESDSFKSLNITYFDIENINSKEVCLPEYKEILNDRDDRNIKTIKLKYMNGETDESKIETAEKILEKYNKRITYTNYSLNDDKSLNISKINQEGYSVSVSQIKTPVWNFKTYTQFIIYRDMFIIKTDSPIIQYGYTKITDKLDLVGLT